MIIIDREKILERWNDLPDIFKEAIYSPQLNDQICKISEQFHLSEQKQQDVLYLCLLVFTGFVHRQDLYKELKESLGIDNKLALEIYGELDKKIFFSFYKDIDRNYIKFSIGFKENVGSDNSSNNKFGERVILKKEDPETINLRMNSNFDNENDKKVISDETPNTSDVVGANEVNLNKNRDDLIENMAKKTVANGPLILSKKEEIKTVEQDKPLNKYKVASFGGFGGSFATPFSNKVGSDISEAKVELPSVSDPDSGYASSVAIPVSSDKNAFDKPKSVHYSSLKTDIKKDADLRSDKKNNLSKNNDDSVKDYKKVNLSVTK